MYIMQDLDLTLYVFYEKEQKDDVIRTYKNQSTVNIREIASAGSPAAWRTMRMATGATEGTPAEPIDAIVAAKLRNKKFQ